MLAVSRSVVHANSSIYFISLFLFLGLIFARGRGYCSLLVNVSEPAPEQSTYGGQLFIRGGQSLKLSTKAAVFKQESLLNGGAKHVKCGEAWPPLAPGLQRMLDKKNKVAPYLADKLCRL